MGLPSKVCLQMGIFFGLGPWAEEGANAWSSSEKERLEMLWGKSAVFLLGEVLA